jgi:hypothetical protein
MGGMDHCFSVESTSGEWGVAWKEGATFHYVSMHGSAITPMPQADDQPLDEATVRDIFEHQMNWRDAPWPSTMLHATTVPDANGGGSATTRA